MVIFILSFSSFLLPLPPLQRKLYVKHMPRGTTKSEIRELFGRYGDVINIDYHYGDSTKLYLVSQV